MPTHKRYRTYLTKSLLLNELGLKLSVTVKQEQAA